MRPFLSLPKKIMFLLLLLLLALVSSLYGIWVSKTNQDLLAKQLEIREQNQRQYLLLNELIRNRIESWVELFVQFHKPGSDQIEQMTQTLKDRFEYLQLNWQVEDFWLFDEQRNLAFSTRLEHLDEVRGLIGESLDEQRSKARILCQDQCRQLLSVPLLLDEGKLGAIAVSLSMLETLAYLNQSTDAALSLVYIPSEASTPLANKLIIRGPLARRHYAFFSSLIRNFPDDYMVDDLLTQGIQVRHEGNHYLLNLIHMTSDNGDGNFVLSAHNISPLLKAHQDYQRSVLIAAFVVFFISGLLLYLVTNGFRSRLILLSAKLPLLAQHAYSEFRSSKSRSSTLIRDELDLLQDSAFELADRLEELDKQVEEKTGELEKIAMYDALTGLPNRNMLTFQLEKAIKLLGRTGGVVAIMFFDLDDFKKVNDSYGHNIGDSLLIEAAKRLDAIMRETDVASRFGGDEFVIMLHHSTRLEGVLKVAEKMLERFRDPIQVQQLKFYVSTSIGIAITDDHECKVTDLIRHADIAMYKAKEAGGNCYRLYDEKMSQQALEKVALESEARDALIDNQFTFAMQPQIELSSNRLMGFEALLRWNHPSRGAVAPGHFIPLLEHTEFMVHLGYWCIDHAFDMLKDFRAKGYAELRIAINLSAIQFMDPGLLPFLRSMVDDTGIPANLIELELTERTLVEDVERAIQIMGELSAMGFIISIDDFGTGYSSLSYLKNMPADVLKIDRSFIDGMSCSEADKHIVASTINMAQRLGMQVVAEGIEQLDQLEFLKQNNCDFAQGYLIARPIPEGELELRLAQSVIDGIWNWQPHASAAGAEQ